MRCLLNLSAEDVFDELFKLAPEKVNTVKEVREIKAPSRPPAVCPESWGVKGKEQGPRSSPAGLRTPLRGFSAPPLPPEREGGKPEPLA